MFRKTYTGRKQLLTALDDLKGVSLDIQNSLRLRGRWSYTKSEGKVQRYCVNFPAFYQSFTADFGEVVGRNCRLLGTHTYLLDLLEVPDTEEVLAPDKTTVDLEYAATLEGDNLKESKAALEDYARTLGYELNKRLSFDNMMKELKDLIS